MGLGIGRDGARGGDQRVDVAGGTAAEAGKQGMAAQASDRPADVGFARRQDQVDAVGQKFGQDAAMASTSRPSTPGIAAIVVAAARTAAASRRLTATAPSSDLCASVLPWPLTTTG
jgi:hypothetical protein